MEYKHLRIAVIDTETTGLSLTSSGICQIAVKIIDFIDGKIEEIADFNTYCFPVISNWDLPFVKKALEINKTSKQFLQNKIEEVKALKGFFDFIKMYNCDYIAGQNVIQFDLPLIISRFNYYGMVKEVETLKYYPTLDTKHICQLLYPKDEIGAYSLDSFRKFFSVKSRGAHNAIYDVEDTTVVLKHLMSDICNIAKANIDVFSITNEEYTLGLLKTKKDIASRLNIRTSDTIINTKISKSLSHEKPNISFPLYNSDIGLDI